MTTEEREEAKAYFQSRLEWHKENRYPYVSAQEIRVCKIAFEALNNNIDVAEGTIISQPCEDTISRKVVKSEYKRRFEANLIDESRGIDWSEYVNCEPFNEFIDSIPPVNPTKTGHCKDCKWWKDSDGLYRRGVHAESQCPINRREVFEGNGYCYMFEPQERSDKE